jgi:AraC-like DNA-binding protein
MSVIDSENTRYKRHVFYLYPSAFDSIGHSALTSFLNITGSGDLLAFRSSDTKQKFMETLESLKESLKKATDPLEKALSLSHVITVFYLLNQNNCQSKNEISSLPDNILMLQNYIDNNFSQISSVSQIAEHFFYSREYVSRLFRKYFDTTISDYIMKRRISESQSLISQGVPILDAAYQVGFGSLSTFIRAFRSVTNMTPSEYRKLRKQISPKN